MDDSRDPRLNLTPPVTRRILKRRDYQTDCRIEFIDPAWAMLPKFAPARTANITEHGVRVEIVGFARKRHEHLCEILKQQGTVESRVCLARTGSVLALPGQIVWAHFEDDSQEMSLAPPRSVCCWRFLPLPSKSSFARSSVTFRPSIERGRA